MARLVVGQFSRGLMTGQLEFGFSFRREGADKVEFELTLGRIADSVGLVEGARIMQHRLERFQWAAEALLVEAEGRDWS